MLTELIGSSLVSDVHLNIVHVKYHGRVRAKILKIVFLFSFFVSAMCPLMHFLGSKTDWVKGACSQNFF